LLEATDALEAPRWCPPPAARVG